ncbi:MAG: SDR family NAD(P)-dependent oxidoreductase, partial [Candidatus Nanopelagicaceae bacterium]
LGFETARGLAKAGFDLLLIARDAARLEDSTKKLQVEFESLGTRVFSEVVDFEATSIEELLKIHLRLREIVAEKKPEYGSPKVLMIAHGVMSAKMSKTLKTDVNEWRRVMAINLDSVFTVVNALAPEMADARDGRVIIFSACLGRMSGPGNAGGLAPYRISKAGVNALVRNLAHETGNGSRGFLVDAICPNHSRTDMGGPDAPRSAAEGAETAIWLATRTFTVGVDQTGVLWEDREVVPW